MFDSSVTGGRPWSPKNYDGRFGPPLTVRQALAKSRNVWPLIRILQMVGTQKTQDWVGRFGFPADRTPPYLTMALGANSTTPLEMAVGMSVFANGGHGVSPYVISMIKDQRGNVLSEVQPAELTERRRVIPARNAFIMNSLLNEVTTTGTAAKASGQLGRRDLFGKTGTTNDSKDAWFAGYQPTRTAVVWMGFDNPRNLGDRETGGGLSLPISINYMKVALKGVPLAKAPNPPEGVTRQGDWVYTEYAGGGALHALAWPATTARHRQHAGTAAATALRRLPTMSARAPPIRSAATKRHQRQASPAAAGFQGQANCSGRPDCSLASWLRWAKNSPWPLVSCQTWPSEKV